VGVPSDTEPADLLRAEIAATGPITFARFMELALYGDHGYYASPPVGPAGDFVTSPHVHPVFAELLARALAELHDGLGHPSPWRLVEAGAGDGTLAAQLLPALPAPVDVVAVDVAPGALGSLAGIDGVTPADDLPADGWDVLIANELLDNLPFRVVRDGREVRVGVDGDAFVETLVDLDDELTAFGDRPDGVVPIGALGFVDRLADAMAGRPGYALLIDYGAVSGPDAVHGYSSHRVVEDVLAAPGATDVTAGVDMDLLAERARARGVHASPVVDQRSALVALGFEAWFHDQLAAQHRQLEERDGLGAVRTWSAKSRATLLVDPAALGRFRWLLLASTELPAPVWLDRAIAHRSAP